MRLESTTFTTVLTHIPRGLPKPTPHLDVGVLGTQVHIGQPRQVLQVQHEGQALLLASSTGLGQRRAPGSLLSEPSAPVSPRAGLPAPPQPPRLARGRQLLVPRRAGAGGRRDLRREESERTSLEGGGAVQGAKHYPAKMGLVSCPGQFLHPILLQHQDSN